MMKKTPQTERVQTSYPDSTLSPSPRKFESSDSSQRIADTLETKRPWWKRIHIYKLGVFLISLYLFMLAIMLMKSGAFSFPSLVQDVLKNQTIANSMGIGWLSAYLIMSGSPVAAAALIFFDNGVVNRLSAYSIVAGSRLGASFVVLIIGLLYILRRRDRNSSLEVGLSSMVITVSSYLPSFLIGFLILKTHLLDAIPIPPGWQFRSGEELLIAPILTFFTSLLPGWGIFLLGLGIIYLSFQLFDHCLPQIKINEDCCSWASNPLPHSAVLFLLGAVLTLLSTSVTVSLSILVPLSTRGIIRRENAVPYIMGANITTYIDTLFAAVLLGNSSAITLVLAGMVSITLVSILILMFFYQPYLKGILASTKWILEKETTPDPILDFHFAHTASFDVDIGS